MAKAKKKRSKRLNKAVVVYTESCGNVNDLVADLIKVQARYGHVGSLRWDIEKEYGYYNEIDVTFVVEHIRPETDEEFAQRLGEFELAVHRREQHEREMLKELLEKYGTPK